MAFYTRAQIFGDNGANGAAVPVSTTNPTGTSANNRGIQFGEPVLASVANRTPYRLAENDEDLNARLARFETEGLNAAYDADGTDGSGRVIEIDGGAVELQGQSATGDTAGAMLRAALYDGSGAQTGLEVRNAGYTFVHLVEFDYSGDTILPAGGVACTLNPGGAGATIVQISGGNRFANSSVTELILGVDLVEITGAGSYSGTYRLGSIVTDARVTVSRIDPPGSPSFPSNTAGTVRVLRTTIAAAAATTPYAAGGLLGAGSLLLRNATGSDSSSPFAMLRNQTEVARLTGLGRLVLTHDSSSLSSVELHQLAAPRVLRAETVRSDSAAVPMDVQFGPPLVYEEDTLTPANQSPIGLNIRLRELITSYASPATGTVAFPVEVATVVGTDKIVFSVDATDTIALFSAFTFMVRLTTLTGTLDTGYYHVVAADAATGNGRLTLRTLNGSTPTFAAATATMQVYYCEFEGQGTQSASVSFNPAGSFGEIFNTTTSLAPTGVYRGDRIVDGSFAVVDPQVDDQTSNPHKLRPSFAVSGVHTYTDTLWALLAHLKTATFGERLTDTLANAIVPRIVGSSGTAARYTLICEFATPVAGTRARIYTSGSSGGLVSTGLLITTNAVFNSATNLWSKDNTGTVSVAIGTGEGSISGFLLCHRASGAGTWADGSGGTGWTRQVYLEPATNLTTIRALGVIGGATIGGSALVVDGVDTSPAPATPVANRLYGDVSGCKAVGRVDITGASTAVFLGTPLNFSGVTLTNSSQDLNFTFITPMADENYGISYGLITTPGAIYSITIPAISQNGFTLRLSVTDAVTVNAGNWSTLANPTVGQAGVTVTIHGRQ